MPEVFLVSSLFAAFFPEQGSGGGGRGSASCSLLTHVLSPGSTSPATGCGGVSAPGSVCRQVGVYMRVKVPLICNRCGLLGTFWSVLGC